MLKHTGPFFSFFLLCLCTYSENSYGMNRNRLNLKVAIPTKKTKQPQDEPIQKTNNTCSPFHNDIINPVQIMETITTIQSKKALNDFLRKYPKISIRDFMSLLQHKNPNLYNSIEDYSIPKGSQSDDSDSESNNDEKYSDEKNVKIDDEFMQPFDEELTNKNYFKQKQKHHPRKKRISRPVPSIPNEDQTVFIDDASSPQDNTTNKRMTLSEPNLKTFVHKKHPQNTTSLFNIDSLNSEFFASETSDATPSISSGCYNSDHSSRTL